MFITKRKCKNTIEIPDNGVSSAGLRTQVQPAARAAPTWRRKPFRWSKKDQTETIVASFVPFTFLVIIAFGKFHGVIIPATPMGCLNKNKDDLFV